MDPVTITNLALLALNQILGIIGQIRGQSGASDDEILAAAQKIEGANDQFYATLKAALATPAPPATPVNG